jgi:hypothetical protein
MKRLADNHGQLVMGVAATVMIKPRLESLPSDAYRG